MKTGIWNGYEILIFRNGNWIKEDDKKSVIYYGEKEPSEAVEGDLWFKSQNTTTITGGIIATNS